MTLTNISKLRFNFVHNYLMKKLIENKGRLSNRDLKEIQIMLDQYLAREKDYVMGKDNFAVYDTTIFNFRNKKSEQFKILVNDRLQQPQYGFDIKNKKFSTLQNLIKTLSSPTQKNAAVIDAIKMIEQLKDAFKNFEDVNHLRPNIILLEKTISNSSGTLAAPIHVNAAIVLYKTTDDVKRVLMIWHSFEVEESKGPDAL